MCRSPLMIAGLNQSRQARAGLRLQFRPGSRASRVASSPCQARRKSPLRLPLRQRTRRRAGQRPLAERVAHLESALPQRDVVRLGAGEVLQCRAIAGRGQKAHVHLQSLAYMEAHLVLAFGDDVVQCRDKRRRTQPLRPVCSGAQAGPVASRSRSPTVSRPRRSEPAGVTRSMPGKCQQICD